MSQPAPPPNQPYGAQPQAGNPYAAQQPAAPTGNPFAGQQPGQFGQPGQPGQPGAAFGGGAPFTPMAPARNNIGLGLLTALGAALVGAFLYGLIAGAIEREVGYIAVGVGFLVGFAASKVGGQNPVLTVVSALLSMGAVYLGQLVGISIIWGDLTHEPATSVFFDRFDVISKAWNDAATFKTYLYLAIGAVGAIGGVRKAS
ncbi:hypothetical protein [Streptomyces brevispora]|uniref:Integral membrane protein n=1 Tax=Streptomyces brevispora TaxID=887462 RepID=A0ABZ1G1Y9_9ACTN|nr:hypothetical protein [Streptomyces brevispora]WSC13800.1 hypothetical protein OIE64_13755 [Streptomyces brevispora]